MTKGTPVIIEAALNGTTHPDRNPWVPITPEQIAVAGVEAADAGAVIVHQHDEFAAFPTPGPEGMAEMSLRAYRPLLEERPELLVYPTANFHGPSMAERWNHHVYITEGLEAEGLPRLRMALVDPGSVTLGITGADGIPVGGFVYSHTFDEIRFKMESCTRLGFAPSIAVFEPGFLRVVLAYHDAGALPPGTFVKLYFSAGRPLFGLPPKRWALDTYLRMLKGTGLPWAVAVFGGDLTGTKLARYALDKGGHLRVGLEDYLGDRTPTNAELVEEAVALCEKAGRRVATPAQAAEILGLPD